MPQESILACQLREFGVALFIFLSTLGVISGHTVAAWTAAFIVIIRRDQNTGHGKKLADGTFTDDGRSPFWINLHRGGHTTTSTAGCQTLPPTQWPDFYRSVSAAMATHGQPEINYYLVTNPEIAKA